METEELTRLVDGIYKNILDKFNPGARQLINAGKAYLKALHGAAAASRVYVDALSRLARQAQLGTWGGSQDVGSTLMRIVEVYKEIQEQEMNILKAFYVDLLVPLETNLEKDTKVVQSEQKKFLQQHKTRSETYSKAAATIKKQRKKSRGTSKTGLAMDKELKNMQILEEEKSKLDAFCEQSLKNAMTQERRRYGFVLERQCSLAKHYASFHEVALAALHPSADEWREVAATREYLPQSVEDMFASRLRQVSFWPEDEENGGSELTMSSQLRKTRSMDSSCLELRLGPPPTHPPGNMHQGAPPHVPAVLSRARSEVNLHASSLSLGPEAPETPPRPRSMAPASRTPGVGTGGGWSDAPLARALFAYLSSGENQLSFLEGDLIALMGDRQKGWQFGENLRTQSSGWFPLAYAEVIIDEPLGSPNHGTNPEPRRMPPCKPPPSRPPITPNIDDLPTGSNSSVGGGSSGGNTLTNASNSNNNNATPMTRQSKAIRPSGTLPQALAGGRRVQPPVPPVPPPQAVTSLHSSNDSGFSNEPPVQPDVDYSDDEAMRQRRRKPRAERIAEADQAKVREEKNARKDWENDSWKTIPRDEKSWQLYKSAMDLWADVNLQNPCSNEKAEPVRRWTSTLADERRYEREERETADKNSRGYEVSPRKDHGPVKREKKYERTVVRDYEYEVARERPNPNQRSKFTNTVEQTRDPGRRAARRNIEVTEARTQTRNRKDIEEAEVEEEEEEIEEEVEEEEIEATEEEEEEEEEDTEVRRHRKDAYSGGQYIGKYNEGKKYYNGDSVDGQDLSTRRSGGYQTVEREERKYENDKSSSSDSEDESTITIPQTGRKVEHIAQKLEQTAQKYAREHSPPKMQAEKRNEYKDYDGREASKASARYGNYLEKERAAQRYERERYFEKPPPPPPPPQSQPPLPSYERERTNFEKNPERNRNVERRSSRRFERPRPPFEEAPQRPDEQAYRERRYSDREEIYGETGRYVPNLEPLDKERGYESNFETKLERNKVIEKHSYQKIDPRSQSPLKVDKTGQKGSEASDGNPMNERKLPSRQNTAVGHLIQTGRNFEIDAKSPKLVKRTKSFWKFRRDSDVLEGMALWQHRSLVDIPKMIRKEERKEESQKVNGPSGKSSPEGATLDRPSDKDRTTTTPTTATTMTMTDRTEEPKPAERMRVPDRNESFDDFPTPAERPKITERSERPSTYFVGNVSRKAILENERKRSLEARQNMVVAELKENNEVKRSERRKKTYGDDDDGLFQSFTETEASDEESTYSCIVVKDQVVTEKTLLPRTKLRRDANGTREKNTCGPWYDLWGVDSSVKKKKKKQQQQQQQP